MADPFTLTAVSMGTTALGGAVSTVGKLMGGASQSSMYKYQQGVARVNQQIAKQNADYARYTGEFEAQRAGMKGRYERASTAVVQSGRGIDIHSGSPLSVRESQGELTRQDERTIRSGAARKAYAYENEAAKQEAAANMYGKASQRSKTASYIDAFGSILGTASSVSSKWLQAKNYGVFDEAGAEA